jgi:colanic acid/amylovoran biosynthesis protein
MNILIVNAHCALNLGDDAIMHETFRALKKKYPEARITLAANDPSSWKKYHDISVVGSLVTWVVDRTGGGWNWQIGLSIGYLLLLGICALLYRVMGVRWTFGSLEQRKLLRAYYEADLVLSCGGGNLYSYHPLSIAFFWTLLCLGFAVILAKRVMLLPQSIGPIEGGLQRWLLRVTLDRTQCVMVRESYSVKLLESLRIKSPFLLLPDLAFGLGDTQCSPHATEHTLDNTRLHIGVTIIDRAAQCPSFRQQAAYETAIIETLRRLHEERKAHLHIFVQCSGPTPDQDDRLISWRVYEQLRNKFDRVKIYDKFTNALDIQLAYKDMDCIIGSRAHTAIFAFNGGVPVVLVGYQPKARGIMEMMGLERYWCSIETVSQEQLYYIVNEALENEGAIRAHISAKRQKMRELLKRWIELLPE